MMSSGPLEPSSIPQESAFPSPVLIPLDFINEQSKASREDTGIDESGLYILSKALEEFVRRLMREATENGTRELEYDSIAKFIADSEFKALKEFFPERIRFCYVAHLLSEEPSSSSGN